MGTSREDILQRLEAAIEDWNTQTGGDAQKAQRMGAGGNSPTHKRQEPLPDLAFHGTPPPDRALADALRRLCDALAFHSDRTRVAGEMLERQVIVFQRLYRGMRAGQHRGQPATPEILRALQAIKGVLARTRRELQGHDRLRRTLRELPWDRIQGQNPEFDDLSEEAHGFHDLTDLDTQLQPIQALLERLRGDLEAAAPAETRGVVNELRQAVTGLKGDVAARMDRLEQNVEALRLAGQERAADPALQHIETRLAAVDETMRELRQTVTQDRGADAVAEATRTAMNEMRDTLGKLQARFTSTEQHFARDDQRLARIESELAEAVRERSAESPVSARITSLTEAFEDLDEHVRSLAAGRAQQDDESEDAGNETQQRLEALASSTGELAQHVQGVLKRMNALEARVTEWPSKDFSERVMRERDQALRDRQETREELARVRAEMEELRRVNAELQAKEEPEEEEDVAAVTARNLSEVVNESDKRLRLGEILVKAGVITEEQLDAALSEQAQMPYRRLGGILAANGYASDETIAYAVACQMHTPFIRLAEESIDPEAVRLITGRLAAHHACIPIRMDGKTLVLAMINPLDLIAIEDVELTTNLQVEPVVVTGSELEEAIRRYYGVEMML